MLGRGKNHGKKEICLDYFPIVLYGCGMATQTQDTHTRDTIRRFALRMAGMRQDSVMRGPMRLLQFLILRLFFKDFFAGMSKLLADLAEQRRNGTLPEMTPAVEPEEARAWPELRQRKSGWAGYRKP